MIQVILAQFFQKFKTKNQKLFAVILLILGLIQYALMSGQFVEIFGITQWANTVLEVVNFSIAALVGTHTSAVTGKK